MEQQEEQGREDDYSPLRCASENAFKRSRHRNCEEHISYQCRDLFQDRVLLFEIDLSLAVFLLDSCECLLNPCERYLCLD